MLVIREPCRRRMYTDPLVDFEMERECLWREIVPELQQFCLNYGAELLIIDPFQSSDKDLTDDTFLLQTLLNEIDQCRQQSAGLFFIVSLLTSLFCNLIVTFVYTHNFYES
jgi:hypothetical protein